MLVSLLVCLFPAFYVVCFAARVLLVDVFICLFLLFLAFSYVLIIVASSIHLYLGPFSKNLLISFSGPHFRCLLSLFGSIEFFAFLFCGNSLFRPQWAKCKVNDFFLFLSNLLSY